MIAKRTPDPALGQVDELVATQLLTDRAAVARPFALPVARDSIPRDLVVWDRWVVWRWAWIPERGGWTKPPANPRTGRPASVRDPITWAPFVEALAAYDAGGWDGVGFVLTPDDPFTGIDLDRCRDRASGVLAPWATETVRFFDSYAEASPSGTGVRIWIRGSLAGLLPAGRHGTRCGPVEVYTAGRFLTVTGQGLELGQP